MAKTTRILMILLAFAASLTTPTFADDWIAQKLRGKVLELVDGAWQPIARGDAVPDEHVVRTLGNTRVLFRRGTETVELGPNTQVAFFERNDGFTTVQQYFGEVKVEADIKNVRHFAVQTPQLVAVVKGTIFVVRSNDKGASVEVQRGAVAVTSSADHSSVTVHAGQEASTGETGTLVVSGNGTLPIIVDAKGKPVKETGNSGKEGKSGSNGNGSGKDKSDDDKSDKGNSGHQDKGKSGSNNSGHGGGKDDEDG